MHAWQHDKPTLPLPYRPTPPPPQLGGKTGDSTSAEAWPGA